MGITLREATAELLKGSAVKVEVALNTLPKVSEHNKLTPSKRSSTSEVSTPRTNSFSPCIPRLLLQLPQKWEVILSNQTCPKIGYIVILTQFQPRLTTIKVYNRLKNKAY